MQLVVSPADICSSSRPQTASPLLGDLKAVDEAMAMGGRLEALAVRGSQGLLLRGPAKLYFATSPRRGCLALRGVSVTAFCKAGAPVGLAA